MCGDCVSCRPAVTAAEMRRTTPENQNYAEKNRRCYADQGSHDWVAKLHRFRLSLLCLYCFVTYIFFLLCVLFANQRFSSLIDSKPDDSPLKLSVNGEPHLSRKRVHVANRLSQNHNEPSRATRRGGRTESLGSGGE